MKVSVDIVEIHVTMSHYQYKTSAFVEQQKFSKYDLCYLDLEMSVRHWYVQYEYAQFFPRFSYNWSPLRIISPICPDMQKTGVRKRRFELT